MHQQIIAIRIFVRALMPISVHWCIGKPPPPPFRCSKQIKQQSKPRSKAIVVLFLLLLYFVVVVTELIPLNCATVVLKTYYWETYNPANSLTSWLLELLDLFVRQDGAVSSAVMSIPDLLRHISRQTPVMVPRATPRLRAATPKAVSGWGALVAKRRRNGAHPRGLTSCGCWQEKNLKMNLIFQFQCKYTKKKLYFIWLYSSAPLIRTSLLPNNSVLIREVFFGEREHHMHSQYFLPNICVLYKGMSFLESVL